MFLITDEVMVLAKKGTKLRCYRLKLDRESKEQYVHLLSNYANSFLYDSEGNEKEFNDFETNYNNSEEENFKISDFSIPTQVMEAFDNPDTLEPFVARDQSGINQDGFSIKAILVGRKANNDYVIAGQKFTYKRIIIKRGLNLVMTNDTFKIEDRSFVLAIPESIDCLFRDGNLIFSKYSSANGVFDLSPYYREASSEEIAAFKSNSVIYIPDSAEADTMVKGVQIRKKIAKILDLHTLDDMDKIKTGAQRAHYTLPLTDDGEKIIWPNDKKSLKVLLSFLAEERYPGVITDNTYVSNSTKKVND